MADLPLPLRMADDEFRVLLRQLEAGLMNGAVVLKGTGYQQLAVEDSAAVGFDDESWESMRPVVAQLAPFIFFAFEDASDDVVGDWLKQLEEKEADADPVVTDEEKQLAVMRVKLIRSEMPNTRAIWREKAASLIPTLGGVRFRVGPPAHDRETRSVVLEVTGTGTDRSSGREGRPTITLALVPSDIAYLKRVIGRIEAELLSDDG